MLKNLISKPRNESLGHHLFCDINAEKAATVPDENILTVEFDEKRKYNESKK